MADSILKLKPIKDILDEVLGSVEPIATYSVGDTLLEFWKPDHISEEHHLRFVSIQVEQMVVGRQYTALLDKLNELSERTDVDATLQAQVNDLSRQLAEKTEQLFPLSCQYLEALSELQPGDLITILKTELAKRNTRKQVPMALFVNKLAEKVREAMQPVEQEAEEALAELESGDEEELENSPLEVLPASEQVALPSQNNAKLLVTTS